MATFTELVDDVYTLTNRPDLVAETKMAVRAATLKLHQMDFFFKDIYETPIRFDVVDYVQGLEYRTLFPKYRSLKYLRKTDVTGTPAEFFDILTPAQVLDRYGYQKENIAYMAGELIQIKSSTLLEYALIGIYQNPDVTEAGFNSWIALDHPFAIVYEAAVTLFKSIGYDEQSTQYSKLALDLANSVKNSNIEGVGY